MQADVVAAGKAWAAKEPKDLPTSLKSDREGEIWMDGRPIAKISGDKTGYRPWPFALAVNKRCAKDGILPPFYG